MQFDHFYVRKFLMSVAETGELTFLLLLLCVIWLNPFLFNHFEMFDNVSFF